MPRLIGPALPAGVLGDAAQPGLAVDHELVMRPWRPADVDAVREAFALPDVQRWHLLRIDDDGEAGAWIDGWAARWAAGVDASWAVVHADDGRVLGQAGLRAIGHVDAQAQLSYWVLPAARGAGVAARATRALTRWAFDTLRLHRMFLQHSTANLASCRVARRAGVPIEAVLRGAMRHADGWHDVCQHARLRTDPDSMDPDSTDPRSMDPSSSDPSSMDPSSAAPSG